MTGDAPRSSGDIDHLVLAVPDLDVARHAYSAMGFQLSPRAVHESLGTANHVFVFGSTYCELLGVVDPDLAADSVGGALAAGSGVAGLALRGSADGAFSEYGERGIVAAEALEFSRAAHIAGAKRTARFRISKFADGSVPGFFTFVCEHLTPEFVWYPEVQIHENGVTGIEEVLVRADDPATAAAPFERVRAGSASEDGGTWSVDLGPRLLMRTPGELSDCYPGLSESYPGRIGSHPGLSPAEAGASAERAAGAESTDAGVAGIGVAFSTSSLAGAIACLEAATVPYAETDTGSIYVLPAEACGVLVEFRQA